MNFLLLSVLIFTALALLNYFPVFFGKIPFPSDIVLNFPPWDTVRGDYLDSTHAELGDIVTMIYPWRAFSAEAIRQYTLPLWNHHLLAGTPFLANGQSAVFYPLNVLYYLLPINVAWSIRFLANGILAGSSMALFVRAIDGTRTGAITSGIIFSSCGFMTAWQAWPHVDAAIWLPLMFFSVAKLMRSQSIGSIVLVSVSFAMPILAGHPETAIHMILAATGFTLFRFATLIRSDFGNSARAALLFTFAAAMAFGLASAQILPTVDWVGRTTHTPDLIWPTSDPDQILGLFSRDTSSNPNSANVSIPESASYVGMLSLLLIFLAPLHRNKRDAFFFALAAAVSLQLIFGWDPLRSLVDQIPIVKGLKHGRLWLLVDFSFAVLAGLGLSALQTRAKRQEDSPSPIWYLLPAGAFLTAGTGIYVLTLHCIGNPPDWLDPWEVSLILLFLGAALVTWQLLVPGKPLAFSLLVLTLLAVDLLSFSYGHVPFSEPEKIFPGAPVFEFLQELDPAKYRVAALDLAYGPNVEMMYGLTTATGFEITLRRTKELLADLAVDELDGITLQSKKVVASHDRRLDLMNVKYLIATTHNHSFETLSSHPDRFSLVYSDGSVHVFENKSVFPRVLLIPASQIEIIPHEQAQLARLRGPEFDPGHHVLLFEKPQKFVGDSSEQESSGPSTVFHLQQRLNEFIVDARVNTPSILVASQTHHPGWKVLVNDQPAPLLRVNYTLSGVALNPGSHTIRFVFRPDVVRTGILVSLISLFVTAGILFFAAVRHTRAHAVDLKPSDGGKEIWLKLAVAALVLVGGTILLSLILIG